jgi:hypothetical protein
LYGRNVYADLLDQLELDDLKSSLLFTIREYLQRLRVMVVVGAPSSFELKKYTLKLLKDLLVYEGALPIHDMPWTSNERVLEIVRRRYQLDSALESTLCTLTDYSRSYGREEGATLLWKLEHMVEAALDE